MENEEFDSKHYIETAGTGMRILPVQATELLGGIGSQILRSSLVTESGCIQEEYACSPEEAAVALKCCDLAELPAWDETALIDAATVGGEEEARVMWGLESRDAIARRVSLAMKTEKAPDVMSPAEGVLLLRRAGINVFHQLLDAVAYLQLGSDATLSNYRLLKGIAEAQQTAPATDTAELVTESETLVVQIDVGDGTLREALPVRAIPYVTGWDGDFGVPPWEVAIRLQTNINLHAWDISAYRVLDGKPVAVQPRQWVMVEAQLAGYSEKLHRLYPRNEHLKPSAEGVAEWQSEAAEKLPARAFVWLDEFKAEYRGWLGSKFKSRPNLVIPEFDLTPLLSEEVRKMVLEGFEQPKQEELAVVDKLFDKIEKLKTDIDDWKSTDHSKTADRLILKQQLEPLQYRLAELEEKKRVLRGDLSESKSEIVADISLQDIETWDSLAQNGHEKYRRLWRAVRLDESEQRAMIEVLERNKATTASEMEVRKKKLIELRVELAQIIRRKDMLASSVDDSVKRAAEIGFVIEGMAELRAYAIPINATQRADEIRKANEEIDALIASNNPTSSTMQNGRASCGAEPAKAVPVSKAPAQSNSTKTPRRDSIDPVIELAQSKCTDPKDTSQVWPQMQFLAQAEQPPFLASMKEGLKYHKDGTDAYFTRDALNKRLHPEKRGTPAGRR